MKQPLFIFPFNGNGLEALACVDDNQFNFIGFIDDTKEKQGKNKLGFTVFSRDILNEYPDFKILAVPGSPTSYKFRKQIIDELNISTEKFATVIHPNATVSKFASIGFNTLIMSGVVITSNGKIGNHVCILPNSVLHHDSIIEDYTLVGSNVCIAGNTIIGNNCYVGSGSNIINGITIGDNTIIGLGSNIIKSVDANLKIAGNPARII